MENISQAQPSACLLIEPNNKHNQRWSENSQK
jgi:hypothetical protein